MKRVNVAVIGALSDGKFISKIEPLVDLDALTKVYLFRNLGNPFDAKYQQKLVCSRPGRNKFIFYFEAFFSLLSLAVSGKISYLISVYYFPYGIIGSLVGLFSKVKVIQVLPGSDLNWIVQKKRFLWLLSKSYKIAVRGNNSHKGLQKLGIPNKKLFVLQNAFQMPKGSTQKLKIKWDIIFVGYIRKPKRIDITIEVIERLKKEFPQLSCIIVGDGPEKENIQNLISLKGLSENVAMVGHQENVEEYLNQSKIFLLTSESEGLPMVLVEALSYGLPVVTSDVNDISDLITNDLNGYLIPSLRVNDYVNALYKILNDHTLYTNLCHNAELNIKEFHKNTSSFGAVQNIWKEALSL